MAEKGMHIPLFFFQDCKANEVGAGGTHLDLTLQDNAEVRVLSSWMDLPSACSEQLQGLR